MQSKEIKELKKYAGKLWNEPTIYDPGEVINKLLTMIDKIPDESPQSKDVEVAVKALEWYKEIAESALRYSAEKNGVALAAIIVNLSTDAGRRAENAIKLLAGGKLSDNDQTNKP